jgi:hypothetical protein
LFHAQSSRWATIAQEHIHAVSKIVSRFANLALAHAIKDPKVRENVDCLVHMALEANVEASEQELARLLEDESRQPITYNDYYTHNIQAKRDETSKKKPENSVHGTARKDDLKEQACLDAQGMYLMDAKFMDSNYMIGCSKNIR